jgi:hypothetical protein
MRSCYVRFSFCLVLLATTHLQAEPVAQSITQYLEANWKTGSAAVKPANEQYQTLTETVKGDDRLLYSYLLICLYQRRFDDAATQASHLLKVNDLHMGAWRAKIWLALLQKHYGEAAADAESLAAAAVKGLEKTVTQEEANDCIRFLGVTFGFLEGPVGNPATASARGVMEAKILAVLPKEAQAIYKDARQSVLEKHAALLTSKDDTKEKAIAADEAEKQKTLEQVAERRATMVDDATKLKEERKELDQRYRSEVRALEKEDQPLADEYNRIETQLVYAGNQYATVVQQANSIQALINREKDANIKLSLRLERDRLNRLANRYGADIASLQNAASSVTAQRNKLLQRKAQIDNDIGGMVANIDKRLAGMGAEERKLDGTERNARKPSSGNAGKAQALATTASALNTYEPFPLEVEKSRLITLLK